MLALFMQLKIMATFQMMFTKLKMTAEEIEKNSEESADEDEIEEDPKKEWTFKHSISTFNDMI